MKKLFHFIFLAVSAFASEHYLLMQSLLDRQTSLAVAINAYIEDRGSIPTSIAVLKSANYLPLAYDEHNPYDKDALTFTIVNKEIRIDSNVETNKRRTDDVLFYGNSNQNRELDRRSVQEGGKLISYYALSAKAATNLNLSSLLSYSYFVGDTNPTTYATVNDGALWFSSTYTNDMYKLYYYSNGWKSLEQGNKNFNSISGGFENQRALQITKTNWKFTTVDVNTVQKSITCFISGTTYNPYKDRCEAYTANACDSLIFRTATGYCDLGDNSGCTYNGGTWDTDKKLCKKGSVYPMQINASLSTTLVNEYRLKEYSGTISNTTYNFSVQKGILAHSVINSLYFGSGGWVTTLRLAQNVGQFKSQGFTDGANNFSFLIFNFGSGFGDLTFNVKSSLTGEIRKNISSVQVYANYLPQDTRTIAGSVDSYKNNLCTEATACIPNGDAHFDYYLVTVYDTDNSDMIEYQCDDYCGISSVSSLSNYFCPYGGTLSGTTCSTVEYFAPDCSIYGSGYAHDGYGRCAKAPTCTAKTMPVSPYYATPYYGNNGVCYSDAGLYCKTYGVSFDGLYTCFNYQFGCEDSSYNLRTDTDVCEKFNLTCSTAKGKRYGLAESPTNNNVTDLYDRVIDKDTKANTYVSTLVNNDVTINDNAGAMCTALEYSTFTQGVFANDYTIGGEVKSGF